MLRRAGHPVELFSVRPEECKAAASLISLLSAKRWSERREIRGRKRGGGGERNLQREVRSSMKISLEHEVQGVIYRRKDQGEVSMGFLLNSSEVSSG